MSGKYYGPLSTTDFFTHYFPPMDMSNMPAFNSKKFASLAAKSAEIEMYDDMVSNHILVARRELINIDYCPPTLL